MAVFEVPVNINRFWAWLVVDELVRSGIRQFCLSPGSRSTPLVLAAAAHPDAAVRVHVDERGSAFFAVGVARATGSPAVWISTSGTASVNGHPAVVEAAQDGIPLVCLTADRPPELRDTSANQTVDQVRLFGTSPRWFFDLPAPSPNVDPRFVLTTIDQAVFRARADRGPVHINCMFREPLADGSDGWVPDEDDRALLGRCPGPYTRYVHGVSTPGEDALEQVAGLLTAAERGLVVVGRLDPGTDRGAISDLVRRLGWPVFSDIRSGFHEAARVIPHFDLLLAGEGFQAEVRADTVLMLGSLPVSKRLQQFVRESRPRVLLQVASSSSRMDPDHRVTHRVVADVGLLSRTVSSRLPDRSDRPNGASRFASAFEKVLESRLSGDGITEPGVARAVALLVPRGHGLFIGNSMPIRDFDAFGGSGLACAAIESNRGASGIDGLVSTAAGFGAGLGAPVTAVLGDLSVLHDLNGLAYLRDNPVHLVVINNDGGGIFSFLPVSAAGAAFEPYFATPHGLSFADAARLFGLAYAAPASMTAFEAAYREAVSSGRSALIEVRTHRGENVALHRSLLEEAGALRV